MNKLFVLASASDLKPNSTHAKLMEFRRLDKEIHDMQNRMSLKELFHSLNYALLVCRANQIIKQLNS